MDAEIRSNAEAALKDIRKQIDDDQNAVMAELADISEGDTLDVLGGAE